MGHITANQTSVLKALTLSMDFSRSPIFPSWSLHKMTSRIPCLISALRIPVSPPGQGPPCGPCWLAVPPTAAKDTCNTSVFGKHAPWENPKLNIFCCGFLKCNLPIISDMSFAKMTLFCFLKLILQVIYSPHRHHLQQTQWLCCPLNSLAFVLCVPWLVFNSNILSLNFIKGCTLLLNSHSIFLRVLFIWPSTMYLPFQSFYYRGKTSYSHSSNYKD